jgi:hypothetical protein
LVKWLKFILQKVDILFESIEKGFYICTRIQGIADETQTGEMAEWSNAAVLKTVEGHTSGGSNPSFSA